MPGYRRKYKPRPLNAMIDKIFHKKFKEHPGWVIADGIAHAIVDLFIHGDSPERVIKAEIKYNLKPLIESTIDYFSRRRRKWR